MSKNINLEVHKRDLVTKGGLKSMRKENKIPGVYYSHDSKESIPFYIMKSEINKAIKATSQIFNIKVGSKDPYHKVSTIPNQELANADLTEISEEISKLEGWSRNPFISAAEPIKMKPRTIIKEAVISEQIEQPVPEIVIQENELNGVDNLNIETVARVGEKVFVIINGQRLREGDLINNLLIESIDNQKITFKMGNTTIIKDVGS